MQLQLLISSLLLTYISAKKFLIQTKGKARFRKSFRKTMMSYKYNIYSNGPTTAGTDDDGSQDNGGNDIDDSRCPRPTADPNRRTMGVSECDDGIRFIGRDLGKLARESYCDGEELLLKESSRESSLTHHDYIPETFVPDHICINETIDYKCFGKLPTHGPHRPNWASFGQYRYLVLGHS